MGYKGRKPQKTLPHFDLETFYGQGVCGLDEAGRGAFAGPVVAAAVILKPQHIPQGIDDSKRLSPAQRQTLAREIRNQAYGFGIGVASVEEIAALNILHASGLAMKRALSVLVPRPATLLIDGKYLFDLGIDSHGIIGGDRLSLSIAAASILAKTFRDQWMITLDAQYPLYGFAGHKGYGVPGHIAALKKFGPCREHRLSFSALKVYETPEHVAFKGKDLNGKTYGKSNN